MSPVMVWVLPEEVCPYANTVPLKPSRIPRKSSKPLTFNDRLGCFFVNHLLGCFCVEYSVEVELVVAFLMEKD